jgi:hypothetical protein
MISDKSESSRKVPLSRQIGVSIGLLAFRVLNSLIHVSWRRQLLHQFKSWTKEAMVPHSCKGHKRQGAGLSGLIK